MSNLSMDLEDGEVVEVDYEVNERNVHAVPQTQSLTVIESNDELKSSSSSSNSSDENDSCFRNKPRSRKFFKVSVNEKRPVKKNYNIWTSIATEDSLMNSLQNCDVGETYDKSRNVEAYDYRLSYTYVTRNSNCADNVEMTVDSDKTEKAKRVFAKPHRFSKRQTNLFRSRLLPKLAVNADSTVDEIVEDMANKLMEEKDYILKNVIEVAGKEHAFSLYNQTRNIEKNGGMGKENDTKRRTSGGVFFFLVKYDDKLTADQKRQIFDEDRAISQKIKRTRRRKRARKEINSNNNTNKNNEPPADVPNDLDDDRMLDENCNADIGIDLDA